VLMCTHKELYVPAATPDDVQTLPSITQRALGTHSISFAVDATSYARFSKSTAADADIDDLNAP
jgi:hypothetical protein